MGNVVTICLESFIASGGVLHELLLVRSFLLSSIASSGILRKVKIGGTVLVLCLEKARSSLLGVTAVGGYMLSN